MKFSKTLGSTAFKLEQLNSDTPLGGFACPVEEYNAYLHKEAVQSRNDHVALTWLLRERSTGEIAAYMSLIADAIKLSVSEKELHDLDYPFKTIPAMKIAKLAVSTDFRNKYKGIGSFMIDSARTIARKCNEYYCAARFLTVDADIEHDEGVLAFYEKNGFLLNSELYNKNRKTISMRKDLYR
ncbi:MAG: GNAT family N-acetyltransferase [Treponema sp.]|nr:GNAT family N-acetyltransferase [Treponema sp.]